MLLVAVQGRQGYHDFYVAYDPTNHRDLFYGSGGGGIHVYDVTKVTESILAGQPLVKAEYDALRAAAQRHRK